MTTWFQSLSIFFGPYYSYFKVATSVKLLSDGNAGRSSSFGVRAGIICTRVF